MNVLSYACERKESRPMIDNINILHLVPDTVFIDAAYKNFEPIAPSCNTFLVPSWNRELRYIKETPVKFVNPYSFKNPYFIKSLERYDFIVLHSLNTFNQRLLANINQDLKFVWIGYGYDYYDLIYEDPNDLYQEKTRAIVKSLTPKKNSIVRNMLRPVANKIFYNNLSKKALIEKINFFAPVLENEYELVASKFDSSFPEYVAWNYGSSADYYSNEEMRHRRPKGNNILVGNSAYPTNNHIESFDLLNACDLGNKKIICPLSYGNSDYANIINNEGRLRFGENFLCLDTFMPREEYFDLISTCSNVIMNHHRQQAAGNITPMLFLGANIFLNEINPHYSFLKKKGAVIFTMNDLSDSPDLLNSRLSEAEIEQNQKILISLSDRRATLNKTENLIKRVISSKI